MKTGTWGGVRHGNAGAAAALLLAMVAGCGGERPQEEEVSGDALAGTEATTTEDSLAAEAPEDLPRWRTAPVELQFAAHRERFTHDPHVEVGCSVCHASVPGHTVHATEECSQCHGAVNLASRRRFREGECLACHHAADQRRNCTQCHASVAPRTVQRSVRLEISGESRERDLPFDHARHVD
ncbi:MAG: hypothetical protein OEZ37_02815, partial [Gemmatimonadota bacterium]|nr:hypothetical protein [Gemmatimonadota bacterium]